MSLVIYFQKSQCLNFTKKSYYQSEIRLKLFILVISIYALLPINKKPNNIRKDLFLIQSKKILIKLFFFNDFSNSFLFLNRKIFIKKFPHKN